MHPAGSLRRLTLGAVLAGAAFAAVPAAANAATTCSYDATTKRVTINDGSGTFPLLIGRSGQSITFRDNSAFPSFCQGPSGFATVTNTDRIVVNGTASASNGTGIQEGFVIDQSGGAFGPGATPETDGNSEIEVQVRQQVASAARLEIIGTPQADTIRVGGENVVNLGNDDDTDINIFRADGNRPRATRIDVDGNLGDDFISGRGVFPGFIAGPATVPLTLEGRAGNDTLVDGLASDTLDGDFRNLIGPGAETGNDTLFSVDGVPDTLLGGLGFDKATVDVVDNTSLVEQVTTGSVGHLRLNPAAVTAKAGGVARVGMSWTHPKAWRQLRSVELRVLRGSERVGRVVVKPATDRVRAHGKLALAAGSRVDHHGKTVTAKLAVRLPKSLAGERLRIDVAATNQRGRTQLEPAAGAIEVR